jgi:beta-glucosidase
VAEIYIAPPDSSQLGTMGQSSIPRPPKELKGFSRVKLQPGETKTVSVPLNTRSFAYYDVSGKQWRADKGTYEVLVGSSSEQIELNGKIDLEQDLTEK